MCITFIHLPHPDDSSNIKLVVAMNRDEFFARPTTSAEWKGDLLGSWDKQPGREGGTWLACSKDGRIGMLTNIFTGGILDQEAKGRGFLVVDYLKSEQLKAQQYLSSLCVSDTKYNPFNLILLEPGTEDGSYSLWLYSRGKEGHTESCPPEKHRHGTFGISNHPVNKKYIKSVKGENILREIVKCSASTEDLFLQLEELLKNKDVHWPDPQIEAQSIVRGEVGPIAKFSSQLSSININIENAGYGTRTHTLIVVDNENNLHFKEITKEEGNWKTTGEKFDVEHLKTV